MPTKTNDKSPLTIAPAILGMGIKGLFGGIGNVVRARRAAKEAGEDYSFGQGAGDFLSGGATAVTGRDFTREEPMEEEPVSYSVAGQPYGMLSGKPFKALSPYTASYSAYNMSDKQAKREQQMKQVSGVNTLSPVTKFVDQTGDGKITQADVIKARTEGYEENPNND